MFSDVWWCLKRKQSVKDGVGKMGRLLYSKPIARAWTEPSRLAEKMTVERKRMDIFENECLKKLWTHIPSGETEPHNYQVIVVQNLSLWGKNVCLILYRKRKNPTTSPLNCYCMDLQSQNLHSLVLCSSTITEAYLCNECQRRETDDMVYLNSLL